MKPLVSYCVKCYNQERYIGKALEAAFAQTYEPLEILICDDASTDRSDEIIRRMMEEYRKSGGKHKVRYYRNERNLGNLGNWQHMCELAEGDLIVKADGDDYSTFDRTEKLVDAWVKDGKLANALVSDGWAIDAEGKTLWPCSMSESFCIGAFEAYSHECCVAFPKTLSELGYDAADDVVYLERAKLLGGKVLHVPERLVYYRQGSGETSAGLNYIKMQTRGFLFMLASAKQSLADLEVAREWLDEDRYREFKQQFETSIQHHQALRELWLGKTYRERKGGYVVLGKLHTGNSWLHKFMLLPTWLTHPMLNMVFWINYRIKRILKSARSIVGSPV